MKLGFIGLGRMGGNMVLNLLEKKHKVVAYNRHKGKLPKYVKKGAIGVTSLKEMVGKLQKPRIVWLMVTASAVDSVLKELVPHLNKGDIVIDGGNSYFKESITRYNKLKKKGIKFLDVGTSGGMEGARRGACQMIGGDKSAFKKTEKLYKDMCVKDGYGYMGKSGAGHFVKMVHNGIEYGMMGAIAEGMQSIKKHQKKYGTKLNEVIKVYANGSIIESRLVSWLKKSYDTSGYLAAISGEVPRGETEKEMENLEKLADMKVLNTARLMRVKTRKNKTYAGKLIAAMRNQFGGHKVKKK